MPSGLVLLYLFIYSLDSCSETSECILLWLSAEENIGIYPCCIINSTIHSFLMAK